MRKGRTHKDVKSLCVGKEDRWRHLGRLGASPTHQRTHCRCRDSTVTSRLTRVQFNLQQNHMTGLCLSLVGFFFSFIVVCEPFVGIRKIVLLSFLIVNLMVTHQTQNMDNCDSSMFCQVQRRVVRVPVRYWKAAILRDVLFMSFETHFHMNRLVQGFRCSHVSEMQMCSWGSKL